MPTDTAAAPEYESEKPTVHRPAASIMTSRNFSGSPSLPNDDPGNPFDLGVFQLSSPHSQTANCSLPRQLQCHPDRHQSASITVKVLSAHAVKGWNLTLRTTAS